MKSISSSDRSLLDFINDFSAFSVNKLFDIICNRIITLLYNTVGSLYIKDTDRYKHNYGGVL